MHKAIAVSFCALASLVLASCDDNKSSSSSTSSNVASALLENPLPDDIRTRVTNIEGTFWFDVKGEACRFPADEPDYLLYVALFFKPDATPWPSLPSYQSVSNALPQSVPLDPDTVIEAKRRVLAAMLQQSIATEVSRYVPARMADCMCLTLNDTKYAPIAAYYKNDSGEITERLIGAYKVQFDRAEFVSEFDRARVQGYVTKHRKYHLFAQLRMNAPLGSEVMNVRSDLVIYFDPEDRVWRIDRQTPWQNVRTG